MLANLLIIIAQTSVLVTGLVPGGSTQNALPSESAGNVPKIGNAEIPTRVTETTPKQGKNATQEENNHLYWDRYENNSLGTFAWSNWRRKAEAAPQMKQWAESVVHTIEGLGISSLEGNTNADRFYLFTAYNEVLGNPLYHKLNWYWKCWMFHSNDPVPSGEKLALDLQSLDANPVGSYTMDNCEISGFHS